MKKLRSQKKKAVRRGLWVLVLLALLVLFDYGFLPSQSLRKVETYLSISPTQVLERQRENGVLVCLSANESVLVASYHKFDPLSGWRAIIWCGHDLSHMDGPATAKWQFFSDLGYELTGATTLDRAVTVQAFDPEDPDMPVLAGPVKTANGISYFRLHREDDQYSYSYLRFLDEGGNVLYEYAFQ